jgi:hypothetical protein
MEKIMKVMLILTILASSNIFAVHGISVFCQNKNKTITYSKNKSAETLEISGIVVSQGFDDEVMTKADKLNVKSHIESYSCEQIEGVSGRYISSSETDFSGTFTLKNGSNSFVVEMECVKSTQSSSHGSKDLCKNDLKL